MTNPLSASCHCGAVHVQVAHAPDFIFECNCSLCDSHGVWWGYYDPGEVVVTGETRGYGRVDREVPAVEVHFCPRCGCTTHWMLAEAYLQKSGTANDRMGVNMRLFDRAALFGVKLHFPDGRAWDGTGEWGYVREAVDL
ncbi:MAG: GFA family protein [Sphingomonadales bacterium]|jgi:hypothetical protein